MHKNVPAVLLINKSIPFAIIKPLYSSFCQNVDLLSKTFFDGSKPQVATLTKGTIFVQEINPKINR
jgi:hypothetical protein